ncbi:hypothetical protein ACFYKX_08995 [Cytobacillus sp. FJAT-54145]|uniref:Uncharacterized protein n=1 Tax=Cytobacillus spartinae TaxID=3299023 RepID=A0ABW6KAI7_9BACI
MMYSGGYTITKKKKTDWNQMLIPSAIILILGSVFIALFLLVPVQEILYKPEGYWVFEPPKVAYGAFIASLLLIAALLIIYAILISKEKNGKLTKVIMSLAFAAAIAIGILSFGQYHYVDKEGIHFNPLFGFQERHYAWSDIEGVKERFKVKRGVMTSGQMEFTFKDGEEYTILINENVRKAKIAMLFELKKQDIVVERIVPEE